MTNQEERAAINGSQRQHQKKTFGQVEVPVGMVIAILSPLIAFTFALKYETSQFALAYCAILATIGSSLGAIWTPLDGANRTVRAICGSIFGLIAFGATYVATIVLSIILKG